MATYNYSVCESGIREANNGAIFTEVVENMHDYESLYRKAYKAIPKDCDFMNLYLKELTPCVLAIISVCSEREIELNCWHYNCGEYKQQVVI